MSIYGENFYVSAFLTAVSLQYDSTNNLSRPKGTQYCSIIYVIDGNAEYIIDENTYKISSGNILYISSDVPYKRSVTSHNDYKFILLNFNLTNINPSLFPISNIVDVKSHIDIIKVIYHILDVWETKQPFYKGRSISLMQELLFMLINVEFEQSYGDLTSSILYLRENFTNDISIDELALIAQMSSSNFMKSFKKKLGISPITYRNNLRINYAKELLVSHYSIKRVAELTGFSCANYFSRLFLSKQGIRPSQYSKNNIKKV